MGSSRRRDRGSAARAEGALPPGRGLSSPDFPGWIVLFGLPSGGVPLFGAAVPTVQEFTQFSGQGRSRPIWRPWVVGFSQIYEASKHMYGRTSVGSFPRVDFRR